MSQLTEMWRHVRGVLRKRGVAVGIGIELGHGDGLLRTKKYGRHPSSVGEDRPAHGAVPRAGRTRE